MLEALSSFVFSLVQTSTLIVPDLVIVMPLPRPAPSAGSRSQRRLEALSSQGGSAGAYPVCPVRCITGAPGPLRWASAPRVMALPGACPGFSGWVLALGVARKVMHHLWVLLAPTHDASPSTSKRQKLVRLKAAESSPCWAAPGGQRAPIGDGGRQSRSCPLRPSMRGLA